MKFSLPLLLYNGIRPTEVRRLRTEDIDADARHIRIRSCTAVLAPHDQRFSKSILHFWQDFFQKAPLAVSANHRLIYG